MCNVKCVKYVFMSYQVIANIKMSDLVFTRQIIRLIMLVRNTGIDFFPYLNKWVKKTANQASFPRLKTKSLVIERYYVTCSISFHSKFCSS